MHTGETPSLSEVITGIKQTNGTTIGKEVSIIEVSVDVLEYSDYVSIAQNAKAFITFRFETVFALKNENRNLDMYHHTGKKKSMGGKRKNISFPKRMFERAETSLCSFADHCVISHLHHAKK